METRTAFRTKGGALMWWLWSADAPVHVHVLDVLELHNFDDVAWLGEYGWTGATDNMSLGLRG